MISNNTSVVNHLVVNQGATPAEWAHFADTLGLRADLLPVVSDLTVPLSATTALKKLDGKTPTAIQNGKAHGIAAWSARTTTAADIGRWSADSRHGVGLIGRAVKAFDIDIEDEATAGAVRDFLEMTLGAMPCRGRAGTGKKLLAFRLAEPVGKSIIKTAQGNIELLGDKQQFLLIGQHKTGTRYTWEDGLPAVIPTLTLEEVQIAWAALADVFGLEAATTSAEYKMRAPVECSGQDPERDLVVQLWDVDHEDSQGRLHGQCPWWTEHTDADPEEVGGMYIAAAVKGQGHSGFKCLHSHCEKRTVFDFLQAVGVTSELIVDEFDRVLPQIVVNTDGALIEVQPLPTLERDRLGRAEANVRNLAAALSNHSMLGARLGYDEFLSAMMISDDDGGWRRFKKTDYTALSLRLASGVAQFKDASRDKMQDITKLVAEEGRFDSAQDWLARLQWDGVPRVDGFCATYFGAAKSPYSTAVSRYLWSGLAARVIEPGAKCDALVTLVGKQGSVKTTAVAAIAPEPEMFAEIDLTKKDDDLARVIRGKLVCEIAELKGLRSRDADSIKAWLSRQVEVHVPKFDEFASRTPRRCMFIGTTNDGEFLDDVTGERRHLPLDVAGGDAKAIARDRDQLWAEARELFRREGVCWEEARDLAEAEHAAFKVIDAWHDAIADHLKAKPAQVRTSEILYAALGMMPSAQKRADEMRVARVLTALGYERKTTRIDGVPRKVWIRA